MQLTPNQTRFYNLLVRFFEAEQRAPLLAELKNWLETHGWGAIKSLNSLTQYLEALEAAGKIRRGGKKRGIELVEALENAAPALAAGLVQLPLLASPVSCGAPTATLSDAAVGQLTVSRRLAPQPERTYIFRATGDSMNRAGIEGGDLVLVEATPELREGDIVLANLDGCGTLKRLRRSAEQITLQPESTNPVHQPIFLHAEDDFLLAGKVVGILGQQ